ncbi:MAG: DUF6485 family protein [Candidatus Omnitrophica bacterium]|jgi:hypothetical protein|nr:DUF6485 family protein [Candidatus Omnitrophota bacterium]MDD5080938.1 DUF6485 family protein [Candidatus Omnitrophota bacterium]MDD5440581.1 DUF6485 family protein [Candidatus Omnitrophota bacterium]
MECRKTSNLEGCTCSYIGCSKKGLCCECVSYHRLNNEIPGCFFPKDAEKTYDRSIENFIRTYKLKK